MVDETQADPKVTTNDTPVVDSKGNPQKPVPKSPSTPPAKPVPTPPTKPAPPPPATSDKKSTPINQPSAVNTIDDPASNDTEPVDPAPKKPAHDDFKKRVTAIEARWGKRFEEVLVEIHDHIFGKSPEPKPANEKDAVKAPTPEK